jgi:hypothetical protein
VQFPCFSFFFSLPLFIDGSGFFCVTQLDRVNVVFHDAVPRTSFGEPPPDPPMLGVYGLLSAMERLGYSGANLEAQVREDLSFLHDEEPDALVTACVQVSVCALCHPYDIIFLGA